MEDVRVVAKRMVLPWPPTANTYWRHNRGRSHISSRGRKYRQDVSMLCAGRKPVAGGVSVEILAYPPDRRRRDLDTLLKPLLDSLTYGGVWGDDYQVERLSIERREVRKGGELELTIRRTG